jgi:hypothetical protein
MMMVANLVGFSVGVEGVVSLLSRFFATPVIPLFTLLAFYSASQIMFEWREGDDRFFFCFVLFV